jgi:hypothetical protein
VRDAKGFVEVQMRDVRAIVTRPADSNLGVHVGAIQINLFFVALILVSICTGIEGCGYAFFHLI